MLSNLLLLACTLFLAAAFAMPPVIAVLFILLSLWLMIRRKRAELAMMLVSLGLVFTVIEVYVRLNADDIFYREHERYALKTRYRANVNDHVKVRFGDLVAMDGSLKEKLAESHELDFATDALGYRNDTDYNGEAYIILGDSFSTTTLATQEEILVSQLNRALPSYFYSLAFPGNPKDYEMRALMFSERHPKARYVWFVYEGNDFYMPGEGTDAPRRPGAIDRTRDQRSLHILPFFTTRVMTLLKETAKATWKGRNQAKLPPPVALHDIGGKPVGFLEKYIERTAAPEQSFAILGTPEIIGRTACVFFIPDKYRVYKPWIEKGPVPSEPAAGLVTLKRYFEKLRIPVVDLTPALQEAAKQQLANGEYVYWRGDTHWNAAGIASIVPEVRACIERDKAK